MHYTTLVLFPLPREGCICVYLNQVSLTCARTSAPRAAVLLQKGFRRISRSLRGETVPANNPVLTQKNTQKYP